MKQFYNAIKSYFGFSKAEMNGFSVLLILIILFLFTPMLYASLNNKGVKYNENDDTELLNKLVEKLENKKESKNLAEIKKEKIKNKYFSFDPNTASYSMLRKLDLNHIVAKRIISYRNKGGVFYEKQDLKKIYGIDLTWYKHIVPYINIDRSLSLKESINNKKDNIEKVNIVVFDINKTDTIELKKIKGVGQVLAERIIKYRDQLGGFINKNQYSEVYGLNDHVVEQLQKYSYIDTVFIPKKININKSSFKTLLRHPYLDYEMVKTIKKYQYQKDSLQDWQMLETILVGKNAPKLYLKEYVMF